MSSLAFFYFHLAAIETRQPDEEPANAQTSNTPHGFDFANFLFLVANNNRPNMHCKLEIIANEIDDVLFRVSSEIIFVREESESEFIWLFFFCIAVCRRHRVAARWVQLVLSPLMWRLKYSHFSITSVAITRMRVSKTNFSTFHFFDSFFCIFFFLSSFDSPCG